MFKAEGEEMIDVTPIEGITRCGICRRPFIYGMAKKTDGSYEIVSHSPDPGRQQSDGIWAHDRCFEILSNLKESDRVYPPSLGWPR